MEVLENSAARIPEDDGESDDDDFGPKLSYAAKNNEDTKIPSEEGRDIDSDRKANSRFHFAGKDAPATTKKRKIRHLEFEEGNDVTEFQVFIHGGYFWSSFRRKPTPIGFL